jgi:hypothetical protein
MLSKNDIKRIIQESKNDIENTTNLIFPKLVEIITEEMTKVISRLCYFCENTTDLKNQDLRIVLRLYNIEKNFKKSFLKRKFLLMLSKML